jgi:spore coat protein CotH
VPGAEPPPPGGWRQGAGGFGGLGGNKLKERFLAAPAFTEVYDDAYRELYRKIYADGTAATTVAQVAAMAKAAGGDPAAVDGDAGRLRTLLDERRTALAADPLMKD